MYSIKYDLLKCPLELTKTYDSCVSGKPKLTVVFIHGIASSSETFRSALNYLSGTTSLNDVRFVAFDLLGSGASYANDRLEYGYHDQIDALKRSIARLKIKTPLVLVGHSMGTLIATKYAYDNKKAVKHLILISPPVYTPEDLEDPKMQIALNEFKRIVVARDKRYAYDRAFEQETVKIVSNKYNYGRLHDLTTPATLIYSDADQIIMPSNVRKVARENKKYLTEIRTIGTHKCAKDKFSKIPAILERIMNETV